MYEFPWPRLLRHYSSTSSDVHDATRSTANRTETYWQSIMAPGRPKPKRESAKKLRNTKRPNARRGFVRGRSLAAISFDPRVCTFVVNVPIYLSDTLYERILALERGVYTTHHSPDGTPLEVQRRPETTDERRQSTLSRYCATRTHAHTDTPHVAARPGLGVPRASRSHILVAVR